MCGLRMGVFARCMSGEVTMGEKRRSSESDAPLEVTQHDIRLLRKNRSAAKSVEGSIRDHRPSGADEGLSSEKAAPAPISWGELEEVRRGGIQGVRRRLDYASGAGGVSASSVE
jgi:hypothetical protein